MYTFKTSERNNDKATEFETKSLLYLMTNAPDSDNVDLFIIDCFNDVTGASANFSHSWDVQSKGAASTTPGKIGKGQIRNSDQRHSVLQSILIWPQEALLRP